MILRNGDILTDDFLGAVKKLLRATMPVRASFKLAQSVKLISANYDEAFKLRTDLIKQYGKENGEGGFDVRQAAKEDQEKFFSELNDLYQIEFDIPLEKKIDLTKVNFPEDVQMSATELFSLQCLANIDDELVPAAEPVKVEEAPKADA